MKAYVITTGVLFALLVVVHVWRAIEEGPHVATDPAYIIITALAAGWPSGRGAYSRRHVPDAPNAEALSGPVHFGT